MSLTGSVTLDGVALSLTLGTSQTGTLDIINIIQQDGGDNLDVLAPIIGSSLEVVVFDKDYSGDKLARIIQDATDTGIEVSFSVGGTVQFLGFVYPKEIQAFLRDDDREVLSFTCWQGWNKLKTLPIPDGGYKDIPKFIHDALLLLGDADLVFLSDWEHDGQAAGLEHIRIDQVAISPANRTLYAGIVEICQRLGLQVFFSNGAWRLYQRSVRGGDAVKTLRTRNKTTGAVTTASVNIQKALSGIEFNSRRVDFRSNIREIANEFSQVGIAPVLRNTDFVQQLGGDTLFWLEDGVSRISSDGQVFIRSEADTEKISQRLYYNIPLRLGNSFTWRVSYRYKQATADPQPVQDPPITTRQVQNELGVVRIYDAFDNVLQSIVLTDVVTIGVGAGWVADNVGESVLEGQFTSTSVLPLFAEIELFFNQGVDAVTLDERAYYVHYDFNNAILQANVETQFFPDVLRYSASTGQDRPELIERTYFWGDSGNTGEFRHILGTLQFFDASATEWLNCDGNWDGERIDERATELIAAQISANLDRIRPAGLLSEAFRLDQTVTYDGEKYIPVRVERNYQQSIYRGAAIELVADSVTVDVDVKNPPGRVRPNVGDLQMLIDKTQNLGTDGKMPAADVTGLGVLATKDTVDAVTEVTNLGILAFEDLVGAAEIDDGAIVETKIGAGAVTTSKINDLAITAEKIGANAVTSGAIQDGSVSEAKLLDASVSPAKLKTESSFLVEFSTRRDNYNMGAAFNFTVEATDPLFGNNHITGILKQPNNVRTITNRGANPVVFVNESSDSTAGNRIITTTGGNVTIDTYQSVELYHHPFFDRWLMLKSP